MTGARGFLRQPFVLDGYLAIVSVELNRIVDQVGQHLFETVRIGVDRGIDCDGVDYRYSFGAGPGG
jgi:hypothetical protein